jgi:hypothetical protein
MSSQIVELGSDHLPAARAFNARMQAGGAPGDFVHASISHRDPAAPVRTTQEIVWDGADVHGGVLRFEFPASPQPVVNFQSPISEGTIDKQYSMVAMQLVRHMQQAGRAFIVGMGGFDKPLPRLLKASGWRVVAVPFFFRVHRPNRFLRELPLLRQSRKLASLSGIARVTGLGWAGLQARHWWSTRPVRSDCALHPLEGWPPWVDEVWSEFSARCSFAVSRDRRTLDWLYPSADRRVLRFSMRARGADVAWVTCVRSEMRDDAHFGNLCVGTILDGLAPEGYASTLVGLADRELRARGCDVVISNQTHRSFVQAFADCGFLSRPSNYLLACTRPLASLIEERGASLVHVTRGDGDGRIHLMSAPPTYAEHRQPGESRLPASV